MKTNTSLLLRLTAAALLLAAISPASFAQTTATTDPVGFITLTVAGGGTVTSPKLSLVSPTVTQPVSWQGLITGVSGTGSGVSATTVLSVSGTPWTANQFNGVAGSFYAEIVTTSPNTHVTGALAVITVTTTGSITVSGNLASPSVFAQVGDTLKIRKEMTFNDIFGSNNSAGFLSTDDPTTADEVLVYDGATSVSYFYYIGDAFGNPAGWYNSTSFVQAGNVVIGPHQGVVIRRKAAAALSFTANGAVKTGDTLFPVVNGLNVLGTVSSKGLTLATSGLYTGNATTGVKPSDDPTTGDEVTIYSGSGQGSYFYYVGDTFGNSAGWYGSSSFLPAGSVVMQPGAAFVLNRKGGPAFNWSLPSPTSF